MAVPAVTTSGFPSPSRSPIAINAGPVPAPVEKVFWGAKDVEVMLPPAEVFRNTPIVVLVLLTTMISGLPSPSISAMATAAGAVPVANVCGAEKVDVVMPPAPEKVMTKGKPEDALKWAGPLSTVMGA